MLIIGTPSVLIRTVMGLCVDAMIGDSIDFEVSEEFELKCVCTKNVCCHLFFLLLW